jgi:hypothetical protein
MIGDTERPEWRELPPVEISVSPPLGVVNASQELTLDEKVRLCDQAFIMLEEQIMQYTNRNLTLEMAAQLRKGWPLEDDSHWDLSISQLLYNRINQLWECAISLRVLNDVMRGDFERSRNSSYATGSL